MMSTFNNAVKNSLIELTPYFKDVLNETRELTNIKIVNYINGRFEIKISGYAYYDEDTNGIFFVFNVEKNINTNNNIHIMKVMNEYYRKYKILPYPDALIYLTLNNTELFKNIPWSNSSRALRSTVNMEDRKGSENFKGWSKFLELTHKKIRDLDLLIESVRSNPSIFEYVKNLKELEIPLKSLYKSDEYGLFEGGLNK